MEENSNLVSIYPNPLYISKSYNSDNYESNLNFQNLTNNYIIFKIQCNQSKLYTIKPGVGSIPPQETINVLIRRFNKGENNSNNVKGQLLLRFYTIDKVINNNSEAREALESKIYNENSLQKTIISIILKDSEDDMDCPAVSSRISMISNNTETILENIGDDYAKGIKEYSNLNENLNKEINNINKNIKDLEGIFEMIKTQKKLKKDKDIAMKNERKLNKSSENNNIKIKLILIILLGLLIGANIANIYNKLFNKSSIKDIK